MLECPRSAFMPPPGMPTLPSRSWTMAAQRIICVPWLCCVQPRAYSMVMVLSGAAVSAIIPQILRKSSFGVPVIPLTRSGV